MFPLLTQAEKPARYTGGEWNAVKKTGPVRARFCLCFPDLYEIGMSNLGLQILYGEINARDGFAAERCYAPAEDMAALLRKNGIPLLSLETATPLKEFDMIGFSVQFELLYTGILYMLDLAGIPFRAEDRGEDFPIIMAGGRARSIPNRSPTFSTA